MSLLRYFIPKTSLPTSGSTPSLSKEALAEANKRVSSLTRDAGPAPKRAKKNHSTYSAEDCSKIGRYAAEQLVGGADIRDIKIDTRTSILKPESANWLIGALDSLS